jgi:predicted RND superfamily exporter protein
MLGIMGQLNLPLSIATVGVSAMILGLGTEYGIFLLERYQEEREKDKSIKESMKIALPAVGSGIIGSGATTIAGFLALTISVMPMLKKSRNNTSTRNHLYFNCNNTKCPSFCYN